MTDCKDPVRSVEALEAERDRLRVLLKEALRYLPDHLVVYKDITAELEK